MDPSVCCPLTLPQNLLVLEVIPGLGYFVIIGSGHLVQTLSDIQTYQNLFNYSGCLSSQMHIPLRRVNPLDQAKSLTAKTTPTQTLMIRTLNKVMSPRPHVETQLK